MSRGLRAARRVVALGATSVLLAATAGAVATAGPLASTASPAVAAAFDTAYAVAPATTAANAAASAVDDADRPLVIVLDTSGSMSDDDGDGTIKLAGAQAALTRAIRVQRPGAEIGLWTYPGGGGGGCEPGSFQIDVQGLDQRAMVGRIRSLTAGGDTPTGDALRAVVDDLAPVYDGATILLISDGLSNCGEDPCAVAEELTADGFDLTVQAAGFQISPEGMAELECIAAATGGSAFEVEDSDQLTRIVEEQTTPRLGIEVEGIPARTPAGSASRVTVTVTNLTSRDVEDARVAFDFARAADTGQSVVPPVLPPVARWGRLPAEQSQTRTWVVAYGSSGKTGTASYRIAAWGSNAQPAVLRGRVEVTDADQGWADAEGPIADLEGRRIAILGDSYSSGEGAGDYLEGTDQNTRRGANQCHKSRSTYLHPLFRPSDVELIACSGATTHHIGTDPASGVREEQVPLLAERQRDAGPVDAAFMTIGGNDIGFGQVVRQCLLGRLRTRLGRSATGVVDVGVEWDRRCSDDAAFVAKHEALVGGLQTELVDTYRAVYDTLNDPDTVEERGRIAPLYVLAYPQAFPERQWISSWCRGFDAAEIDYANDLVDQLNAVVERSVGAVRRDGYHVEMVTATQESFLPDNTACPRPGSEEFMNSVGLLQGLGAAGGDAVVGSNSAREFMHPNARGYRAETNTILSWSASTDGSPPEDVRWKAGAGAPGRTSGVLGQLRDFLTPTLPAAGPGVFDAASGSWRGAVPEVRGGQDLAVEVVGAAPGSTVSVMLQSRARLIGTVRVGADGTGSGEVRLPPRAAAGTHELTALGFDAGYNAVVASTTISVDRAIPMWLVPLAISSLVALVVSALAFARLRRRRAADGSVGPTALAAGP